jgi:CSLREA domain-containing protein
MRHHFARFRARSPRLARRPQGLPLRLEWLEDRLAPAVVTVTTAADDNTPNDGSVSLREAIQAINNGSAGGDTDITNQSPGAFGSNDTIHFAVPQPAPGPVVQTINVGGTGLGALPALLKPMTVDGYSEPGASANTLAIGDNAKILIELNGAGAGPNADGIRVTASDSTVEGLAVNRFSANGIELQGGGNTISGNFVGTDPAGTTAEPNQLDGMRLSNSSLNRIGIPAVRGRNVVSGNLGDGIHVVGTTARPAGGNDIGDNYVGTNAAGTGPVGVKATGPAAGTPGGNSLAGIEISGGGTNLVGDIPLSARNVVGFNAEGIELDDGAQFNTFQDNYVGVGADGFTPVGNNFQGIVLRSADNLPPPLGPGQANEPPVADNSIGLNLVAFNGAAGVAVFGNPPRNNATQAQNSGNSIQGNLIYQNGRSNPAFEQGIDLSNQFVFPQDDGRTNNDAGHPANTALGTPPAHGDPSEPNNFQNFPVLTAVAPANGGVHITGSLTQSVSHAVPYQIELFANNPDPLGGAPEGQFFLGRTNVTADGSGTAAFSVTLADPFLVAGQIFTATATNLLPDRSSPAGSESRFNTSEFSPGLAFLAPSVTALMASPNPVTAGQPVTFAATVGPANGFGAGAALAGSVEFLDGPNVLATVALSNGSATFSTAFATAGDHPITAVFLGNSALAGSTSPTVFLRVNPPPVSPPVRSVGVFDPATATWYLRSSNGAGAPDAGQFQYGVFGSVPVAGSWAGAGPSGIGVFDPTSATWYLRNEASAGAPDAGVFQFGGTGFVPVVGDWQGSGHTGVGVFDPTTATWYLRNEASAGAPDAGVFRFGVVGGVPVVGDWAGTGHLGIGVFDPATATWFLRSSATAGAPDVGIFQYGGFAFTPVAGDWTGSGHAGIGAFDPISATFYLRTEPSAGAPDAGQFAFGGADFLPVAGAFPPAAQHLLAAGGEGPGGGAPLGAAELQSAVAAALARVGAADTAPALQQRLASAEYGVGALPPGVLGLAEVGANRVTLSADAAGYGWSADGGSMDLATAVLHEMGHLAGLPDEGAGSRPGDLMADALAPGAASTQPLDLLYARAAVA